MTTERVGASWRRRWAELGRSSLEYMLMRWLERKGGMVGLVSERDLRIWAWMDLPRRGEWSEREDWMREARKLGVKDIVWTLERQAWAHGC